MTDLSKAEQELVEQLGDFVKLFVHKGEDGDDPPEKWAWTIRGSFPTEVMLWIRSHTDALIGAAYEACAGKIENFKFLCEENERAYASAKRIFAQAIRDFTREATRDELERIKAEAERKGRLELVETLKWALAEGAKGFYIVEEGTDKFYYCKFCHAVAVQVETLNHEDTCKLWHAKKCIAALSGKETEHD